MSDGTPDLDGLIEAAWRAFRRALADGIDALESGDRLLVELDGAERDDGALPYVRVRRRGDLVYVEVPGNGLLAAGHQLSAPARDHVRQLGLSQPETATVHHRARYPCRRVDQAASVAVSALRTAFGIVHPAFLRSDDVSWQLDPMPSRGGAALDSAAAAAAYARPVDRDHLDQLIDAALTPMLGHVPERDQDGDVPIPAGSAVVFVRSDDQLPLIRLFAVMVVDIEDPEAAVHDVSELNREIEGVTFVLHGDCVVASTELLALLFVPEHLRLLVARMCNVVSSNDAALARRVGGRVYLDETVTRVSSASDSADEGDEVPDDDDIHPVMLSMLHLDAEKPGSLRPKLAAELCGYDSGLLLELIRWNEEQEIAWRQARDEACAINEYDRAAVCEHERAHARRTIKVLRKALRRVLLG